MSENQLVAAAKSGNHCAFGELVERNSCKMMRIAQNVVRNHQDAEDAVQDAFLSALLYLKSFDGRSSFSTWLTRIVINAALMKLRKNRRLCEIPIEERRKQGEAFLRDEMKDAAPNPEERYVDREHHSALTEAILALRPKLRAIIIHHMAGESIRETSQALGISIPATKARLFHARVALRRKAHLTGNLGIGSLVSTKRANRVPHRRASNNCRWAAIALPCSRRE